jgi:hypothetical protein
MRFVRHPTNADWGLGVVAAEDPANVTILFEGIGYMKVAKVDLGLLPVADAEVPPQHAFRKREDWPKVERDGKRAVARRDMPQRFDALIEEFSLAFPGGLRSPQCDAAERDYKVEAGQYARQELDPVILDGLLTSGAYAQVLQRARRALSKVNFVSPNELVKFKDIPASAEKDVAVRVVRLVKAADDTPAALADLAAVLAPHGAAQWPIVSLLPFLLDPEHWPFVDPAFIERAEKATGIDVEYAALPNARTYELIRDLYGHVAGALGERGFAPRDFIDVHTFLWVASGMAREKQEARDRPAMG